MISNDNRAKIVESLRGLQNQECADMFERYQILAEHIYPVLVKDKQVGYDVRTLQIEMTGLNLEEFRSCEIMEDDIVFAVAFLLYGNDIVSKDGKFYAR